MNCHPLASWNEAESIPTAFYGASLIERCVGAERPDSILIGFQKPAPLGRLI
jgi:hypothetical protein